MLSTRNDIDFFHCGDQTLAMRIHYSVWLLATEMDHCGDCTYQSAPCTLCENLGNIDRTESLVNRCKEIWTTLSDGEISRQIIANLLSVDDKGYTKESFTQIQAAHDSSAVDQVIQITRNSLRQDIAARKQWFREHGSPDWG